MTPKTARIGPHHTIGMKKNVCEFRKITCSPVAGSTRSRGGWFAIPRPTDQHAVAETNRDTANGHLWLFQYASLPAIELVARLAIREKAKTKTATRYPLPCQIKWIIG